MILSTSKKAAFLLIACILGAVSVVHAQKVSIDSCYAAAVQNYPMIARYDLIAKTEEYTLSNASKAYLPQVDLTGIAGYLFTSGQSDSKLIGLAQLNQTIWDGGATKARKNTISANAEAEMANLDVSLYELRSRVNQLYFGILLTDQQLNQVEQHREVLNNSARRIREMNENGLAYQTDLDEIKVEQLSLNQQRTEFLYVKKGFIQMLSLLTGMSLDEQTVFEIPEAYELNAELSIHLPELSYFESQRSMIRAQDGMRKAGLMPKVGILGAGVLIDPEISLGPASLSSLGVVGLSAKWNISGLYQNGNKKKLSQLSLDGVDIQQETFLFNTRIQTSQTLLNVQKQKALLDEDQNITSLRKDIRKGYQLKYENGMASLLELLDATEKENQAMTNKSLHEMQLLMALYEYKTQTGNE